MCTQHKDKRHANEEIRKMSQKLRVGILGATGMVGQRFHFPSGKSSLV